MTFALLFDTETTGLREPQLIEMAGWRIASLSPLTFDRGFNGRYKPSKPIEFGAMAKHHITEDDLVDMPPHDSFVLPAEITHLIGHNIDFDWKVIGKPDVKCIDTRGLCRLLWPETDSHSLLAMIYMLEPQFAKAHGHKAHSALGDVEMLEQLLLNILGAMPQIKTIDDLWEASENARIPRTMPFGPHKGELIRDVPVDYRTQQLEDPDLDPYLRKALETAAA